MSNHGLGGDYHSIGFFKGDMNGLIPTNDVLIKLGSDAGLEEGEIVQIFEQVKLAVTNNFSLIDQYLTQNNSALWKQAISANIEKLDCNFTSR